jgi:hypothetical protein
MYHPSPTRRGSNDPFEEHLNKVGGRSFEHLAEGSGHYFMALWNDRGRTNVSDCGGNRGAN